MTAITFLACALTAYVPALSLFWLIVRPSAELVILLLSRLVSTAISIPLKLLKSSFLWLVAALLAAVVWVLIPPLQTVYGFSIAISVLFQELMRYSYQLLVRFVGIERDGMR